MGLGGRGGCWYATIRNSFRANLLVDSSGSDRAQDRLHSRVPVELADFSPTSTTIAVSPGGEAGRLPESLLPAFDKYFPGRASAVRSASSRGTPIPIMSYARSALCYS